MLFLIVGDALRFTCWLSRGFHKLSFNYSNQTTIKQQQMKVSELTHLKEFTNDVIKQGKPFYKQVKRMTMYKDNKPMTWGQYHKLKQK